MIFIIATHSFLIEIELDKSWSILDHRLIDKGYHYGIAIVSNHNVSGNKGGPVEWVVYRGGDSIKQDDMKLIRYKGPKSIQKISEFPLKGNYGGIHQLVWANGGIYIANTHFNCVMYKNLAAGYSQKYTFEDTKRDWNHVNSIFPCGDRLFVLLHNQSRKESEVAILRHHITKGFVLEKQLSLWNNASHNIFIDDDFLIYNASAAHKMVFVDHRKDKIAHILSFDGYHTKGLSVLDDYIIVGLSEHTVRDKRATSHGYLAVIDRHSLSEIARIGMEFDDLPHPIGNINEIRCTHGGEHAHAHSGSIDLDFANLRMAKGERLNYLSFRAKTSASRPLRLIKQYIEKKFSH